MSFLGADGAADGEPAGRLGDVRLTCCPIDQPVPRASMAPARLDADPGLGEHALAAAPGNHWLAIEQTAAKPMVLPLSMLEERVTLVVVTLVANGVPGVFEFIPPRMASAEVDLPFMRQVEFLEQLAKTPQLYTAEPLARELITTRPTPPVAATLGAYLLLRLGYSSDLDEVTQRLTSDYGQLSECAWSTWPALAGPRSGACIVRAFETRLSGLRRGHHPAARRRGAVPQRAHTKSTPLRDPRSLRPWVAVPGLAPADQRKSAEGFTAMECSKPACLAERP